MYNKHANNQLSFLKCRPRLRAKIPILKSCIVSTIPKFPLERKNSPPGNKAVAYMTLVIGLKSSCVKSDDIVNSIYGSHAVMIASA